MKKYIEKLSDFTIKKTKTKNKAGYYEGIISFIVNILIFIIKLVIGLSIQSIALITDAFHSLSDSLSSIVIIIGFYYSSKPADKEHPFGHARSENIASLIVAIMLFIISFEFFKDSLLRIIKPEQIKFSIISLLVIMFTIVIKEILSQYSMCLGKKLNSVAIETDAYHHKTDVYATCLVLISIIMAHFGIMRIDGVIGCMIALYIAYIAYKMAKKSINPLLGEKPSEKLIEDIKKIAKSFEYVEGIHDIIVHNYGDKNIISFHIEVPDSLSPCKIHDIADEVEKKINNLYNATCVIHQDPINTEHPYYDDVKNFLNNLIDENLYHDLKLIGTENKFNVIFDLNEKLENKQIKEIKEKLKSNIKGIDDIIIKIEPEYVYS
jgi:cation diffusion facilitator family transporter